MDFAQFDERPIIVAIAGPNGAGKTTFYHAHLYRAALPFINADVLARNMDLDPYAAAHVADALRSEFVRRRESFIFETVFSDPVGDKLAFLEEAADSDYTVVLCFIGISGPQVSEDRIAMRVSQGGHDVPTTKLHLQFPRTLANLRTTISELPRILIYDNDDLNKPYRQVAAFTEGYPTISNEPLPRWLKQVM